MITLCLIVGPEQVLEHGIKLRLTCERAWHSLFARNMFIHCTEQDLNSKPDFEVFHAPGFLAQAELDHTNSEAAIVIDFSARRVIFVGLNMPAR